MTPQRADGNDELPGDRAATGDADSADVTAFRATADAALFGFQLKDDAWFGRLRGAAAQRKQMPLGKIGPYELISVIGQGGQGIIYKARQPHTGRIIALKRLGAGVFATSEMRARLRREVEAAAALEHPNIVTVYGSELIDDQLVLAMQWVDGLPLDRWVRPAGRGERSVRDTVGVFIKICAAVQHAHDRGIIHRDLKPSNVLVDEGGEPHVLDFGLARQRMEDSSEQPLTLTGAFLGTPAYASPEQLRGDHARVDGRSDVYSLGALLFCGLTGSAPVDPLLSPTSLVEQIERVGPRSPAALNPALDREICAIVLKALQPEPGRRYSTVAALCDDVQRYRSGRPVLAHPPGAGYWLRKFVRRNSLALIVASIVTVSLAAALISNVFHSRRAADAANRASQTRDEFNRLEANRALDEEFNAATTFEPNRKYAEAEARYRDILARRRSLVGDDDPSVVPISARLAHLLYRADRWSEADLFYELAFNASKAQYGLTHPMVIESGIQLANNRLGFADYKGAESVCMELPLDAVTVRRGGFGSCLVHSLILQGRFSDAISPARHGLNLNIEKYGKSHLYALCDRITLGELLHRTGDEANAQIEFEETLTPLKSRADNYRQKGDHSYDLKLCLGQLGYVQFWLSQFTDAERTLREACGPSFESHTLGQTRKGTAMTYLGTLLMRTARGAEGEQLLLTGQPLMTDPNYMIARYFGALALIEYYEADGRTAEAAHWRECLARRPFREWLPQGVSSQSSSPTPAPGDGEPD